MPCYHPIPAWRSRVVNRESGKRGIAFLFNERTYILFYVAVAVKWVLTVFLDRTLNEMFVKMGSLSRRFCDSLDLVYKVGRW